MNPHNDELIKDLYEKFPDMTNVEAARLGFALQRVIRGESLEDMDPDMAQAYLSFMARADQASAQWDSDRRKFIEDSFSEANRPSEKDAARLRQEAKERFDQHRANARLNSAAKKKMMEEHIKNGPFEELYVEPKVVMGRVGDHQETRMEGQIIGLNGVRMYLPPGLNKRVPSMYAERYRQIQRGQKETEARKEILQGKGIDPTGGKHIEDGWQQLAKKMHEINRESGSQSGSGEAGDRWDTPDLWQPF